jgi:hypothetical protein
MVCGILAHKSKKKSGSNGPLFFYVSYFWVHPDDEDGQFLATAANALGHAVERRVLSVD